MRDLYKWEKRLPPWKEKAEEDILDWIGRREEVWDDVRESLYQPIEVAGTRYDAFDTTKQGTLPHLIKTGRTLSLALNAAFLDGLGRELFPGFRTAFSQYMESGDLAPVCQAVTTGYNLALAMTHDIIMLYRSDKDTKGKAWVAEEISRRYLKNKAPANTDP